MRTDKIILTRDITLSVDNARWGESGTLIVKQDENGGHAVFLPPGHYGNVAVEPAPGKSTLLEWLADDEGIYWTSLILTPAEGGGNASVSALLDYPDPEPPLSLNDL